MKFAVLGTSNGIDPQGHFGAAAGQPGATAVNLSLGASACPLLHYRLHGAATGDFTHAVIETLVNDQGCLWTRTLTLAAMDQHLHAAIDRLRSLGVQPLALLMPTATAPTSTRDLAARQAALYAARDVPHCNFVPLLEHLAAATGRPYASFFRDPAHVDSNVARLIAGAFYADTLAQAAQAVTTVDAIDTPDAGRYGYISVRDGAHAVGEEGSWTPCLPLRQIHTSLLRDDAFAFPPGARVRLPAPAGAVLSALVLNIKASCCTLRLQSGGQTVHKDGRWALDPSDAKVIVTTCAGSLRSDGDGFVVSADGLTDTSMEATYFVDEKSVPAGRLELLGAIVRFGDPAPRTAATESRAGWWPAAETLCALVREMALPAGATSGA